MNVSDTNKDAKPLDPKAKAKALDAALTQIKRRCGQGAIMRLGEVGKIKVPAVRTGCLSLDIALGVGGLPRGRIVEIFGPEASGKTTLALHTLANAQKAGGTAAFIDAEHALDPSYAQRLGVDLDSLLVSQPDYGEQALEIADTLIASSAVDLIVVDSVAALVPKNELDGEMGDTHVGLQARLMSQAMRKLTSVISRSNTLLIFINQIREKVGVMFGSPETTPGGRALKYYSSVRIDIRRIGAIKDGDRVIGAKTRVKVVKNKVAPPFQQVEFEIRYGYGISHLADMIEIAVELGIISKSGTWMSYGNDRLGQGKERAMTFLAENKDIRDKLEKEVLAQALGDGDDATDEAKPDAAKPGAEAKPGTPSAETKPTEATPDAKGNGARPSNRVAAVEAKGNGKQPAGAGGRR